ncbi:MAG: HD domain-containing protein [Candidatus Thorarchaeota archaeon]|nr:HD domain-containing protein [Candidatus Thorarchaeota archaeon]
MEISQEIIGLARNGETLKKIGRTGWALAGVDSVRQESVGEHSYGTILVSLLISKALLHQGEQVDLSKVITLAALHDLPESMTSDIPRLAVDLGGHLLQEGKKEAEKNAFQLISKKSEFFGEWLLNLWQEMEVKSSTEVRIVRGADIIDMLVHAVSLENSGVSPKILNQFFISSHTSLNELEIGLVEDIFWDLYKEHIDNANSLGIKLEQITRS